MISLSQVLRIALPYECAAIGGVLTERSGVIDLALESKLIWGAFAAATAAHATGSVAVSIVAAMLAGAAVGLVQWLLGVVLRAHQAVVGVALNIASYGLTRYLLALLYGSSANSPHTVGTGSALFTSPVFWCAIAVGVAAVLGLRYTATGLRIRAAGERPDALIAAGISPSHTRMIALAAGGAIAGLGGAQLALAAHGFSGDMSGGRGYIALVIVILSGWRPALAAALCIAFGAVRAEALQLELDAGADAVRALVQMLPYLVTLAVLVIVPTRSRMPKALGRQE